MADAAIKLTHGVDTLSVYPVGSIYMSTVSTNPSTYFGGTWQQIEDKFLLCAGSTYSAGSTGGEETHTLVTAELPSHTHTFTGTNATTSNTSKTLTGGIGSTDNVVTNMSGAHILADGSGIFSNGTQQYLTQCYFTNGTYYTVNSYSHRLGFKCDATHSHTCTAEGTNSNAGSDGPHNNMPPYLAVYTWKRIA